jgi:hypothetical protein
VHLLNAPVAIHNIVNLFRPFLKKKLVQKVITVAEVTKLACLTDCSAHVSCELQSGLLANFTEGIGFEPRVMQLDLFPLFLL